MKKNGLLVLVVILVIAQVISYSRISDLQQQIQNVSHEQQRLNERLMSEMSQIYATVEKKMNEQASAIEYAKVTIGAPDNQKLTVPVTYTVTPKEVSDKTSLSLSFNGETLPMDRSGTSFSLTTTAGFFEQERTPDIIISEGNITRTEKNESLYLYSVKHHIFPEAFAHIMGGSEGNSKRYKRYGTITFDKKDMAVAPIKEEKAASEAIRFTKATFVVAVDDVIISEKSIAIDKVDGYEVKEEIPLMEGQTCTMTLIIQDNLGLFHHYPLDVYVQGAKAQREPFFENEKIYTKDGKLLWSQDGQYI